jgi:virulence-associated protein VagC
VVDLPTETELEFERKNLEVYVFEKFKIVDPLVKDWKVRKQFAESVLDLLKGIELASMFCDSCSGGHMKVREK